MRIVTVFNTKSLTGARQEYEPKHVQALQRQVDEFAPGVPFECLSDVRVPGVHCVPLKHGYPGWWAKMELMRPDFPGDFLFLDLDTVLVGPLTDILKVRELTLLRDFYRDGKKLKEGLGGGLMYLPENDRSQVWNYWIANPNFQMRLYCRGDQFLFERFWLNEAKRWQDVVPGQVVSYKVHCSKGVPPEARIVCFHGVPRPWAVGQFLELYR